MLINFTVDNYRSINDRMLLNLTAAKRFKTDATINVEKYDMNVLPVTGIYGANGSGKSNLAKSIWTMQRIVMGEAVPAVPFLYESEERTGSPSSFSMLFIADDGIMYHYGFSVQGVEILEEWLSAYYTKRESMLFERSRDDVSTKEFEYSFGGKFIERTEGGKVYLDVVSKGLSSARLFLTELAEKNFNSAASTVADWFSNNLLILTPGAYSRQIAIKMIEDNGFRDSVTELFRHMDFDFDGFCIETREIGMDAFLAMTSDSEEEKAKLRAEIQSSSGAVWTVGRSYRIVRKEQDGRLIEKALYIKHRRADGESACISIENASNGFKRVLDIVQVMIASEEMRNVSVVIDEIEQSLHTLISKRIIEEFKSNSLAGLSSQLVFITHDTNLLDLDILRRDEVQFMEKDRVTSSSYLTNYAEFKIIPGLNLEKGYLEGRFGAIPILHHNLSGGNNV